MSEFATPLTTDADIATWEPQLTSSASIAGKVDHLHEAASDEVARDLRVRWWAEVVRDAAYNVNKTLTMLTLDGMDTLLLSRSQLYRLAVYRLLGWHIWPMLNPMNDPETMAGMKEKTWKKKYSEELDEILGNGVAYDWNQDGTASLQSETTIPKTRSVRLERA
jgi:hypothetical protein